MKKTIIRKLLFLLVVSIVLIPLLVSSAEQVNVIGYTPVAYSRLVVTTSSVSQLSTDQIATAGAVFITVEDNNIRYRIDGGIPGLNYGHLVVASAYQNIWLNDPASIKRFRAIAIGGNAILQITYYKRN